jgi:serine/threonine protein kinase
MENTGSLIRNGILLPGSQLGGYVIENRLATGGMSHIYLARTGTRWSHRQVVLKVLLPHLLEQSEMVKMFRYEARLASMLRHPNLVEVQGLEQAAGEEYMVMEYLRGWNLRQVLRTLLSHKLHLPRRVCLHIVLSICDCLDYIHRFRGADDQPLDIIHRDVSLENILLTRSGQIKLLDFGIAKASFIDIATAPRRVKGKLLYMAPEVVNGQRGDQRIDVYALGVVLYCASLMRRPYNNASQGKLLRKIMTSEPPRPREVDPTFPEELEAIILRAMHRDLDQRYPSAADLRRDLATHAGNTVGLMFPDELADYVQTLVPLQDEQPQHDTGQLPAQPSGLRQMLRQALPFMLVGLCGLASGALTAHQLLF